MRSEFIPVPTDCPYDADFVRKGDLRHAILGAREVVDATRNIAIATAGEDGVPHNTVITLGIPKTDTLALDFESGTGFWGFPGARRIRNLGHMPTASIVVYSSTEDKGSLSIEAEAREVPFDEDEIESHLNVFNLIRASRGVPAKHLRDFDPEYSRFPAKLFRFENMRLSVPIPGYSVIHRLARRRTRTRYEHSDNVQFPVSAKDIWAAGPPRIAI